jgi:hypothetical protein
LPMESTPRPVVFHRRRVAYSDVARMRVLKQKDKTAIET